MDGTVSIIMPAYNEEKHIEQAVRSVLNQTYPNFELIIINDGSTDATPRIIKSFQDKDSRIHILDQANSGQCAIPKNNALRLGLAQGEYVSFLDADDFYEPTKLEKQVKILSDNPAINICFHDLFVVNEKNERIPETYLNRVNFLNKAKGFLNSLDDNIWHCSNEFYRFMSSEITAISIQGVMLRQPFLMKQTEWFNEDFRIGEDIDLWFRLAIGQESIYIDQPLCSYRRHEGNITGNPIDVHLGSIVTHTKNYERGKELLTSDEKRKYAQRISNEYQFLAYQYYVMGEDRKARGSIKNSLRFSQSFSAYTLFFKSFIPRNIRQLLQNNS